MKPSNDTNGRSPHLFWVAIINPETTMDAATWVDTSRELEKLGWRVTLAAWSDTDGVRTVRGVDVHCYSIPAVYLLGKLLFHLKIIKALLQQWSEVDVVMFHQISAPWLLPLRLLRMVTRGKRPLFIMDTRDLPDPVSGSWRVTLHLKFYYFAHWLANHFADGQIAITDKMAEMVNIPRKQRLGTWPSGVDVSKFSQNGQPRQWPQKGQPIELIYIGSLLQKRNPLILCQAVQAANEAGMRFELSIYGDGEERLRLEAVADASSGMVQVLPPVPHHTVPNLLSQAHVGVTSLPEPTDVKYEASSPVKLFEYMASGLPLLATTNYCHTEVVGNGRFAFWVNETSAAAIQDTLAQLWQQRSELPKLSQEAHQAAADWTWAKAAQKLSRALYNAL